LLVVLIGAACASPAPGDTFSRTSREVLRIPVRFAVHNNPAPAGPPCPVDGGSYEVVGHLVGPRRALASAKARTVSVLLSGFDTGGEWGWALKDVPGYDTPAELARMGHGTLSLDMLGYGSSGRPHGTAVCLTTQAEVTHQIVQQLRAGTYTARRRHPMAFSHVVLVSHDVGGTAAQIEASLYQDVNGLVEIVEANQGFTPFIVDHVTRRIPTCLAGGDGSDAKTRGDGYLLYGPEDDEFRRILFANAEPAVIRAVLARRDRNPCGYIVPTLPPAQDDVARLARITFPVLLMYPTEDPVYNREGQEAQAAHFTGSNDVTTAFLEGAGHFPMFERSAPRFRATLSKWLKDRFPT
jgi:pimeloyl-ACP methyl ester carboxylesterase